MTLPFSRRTVVVWLAAVPIGVAYGLAALAVALGPGVYTTYEARAPLVATAAGLALVDAGVASALGPAGSRTGALALIAGALWFAPVWIGWSDGPTLIRGLAALAAPFLIPVVVHLVATYAGGRIRSAADRALIAAAYGGAAVSALGYALFRDPLSDANCWDNCTSNPFLVRSLPGLVRALDVSVRWFATALGMALVVLCASRLRTAPAPVRRTLWPVLLGGAAVGAAVVGRSVALGNASERPGDPVFRAIFVALAAGTILIAAGPLLAWFRSLVQRRAVGRIVAELGEVPEPGTVRAALARAVGDPGLAIAYWVPSASRFVDAHGHAVAEPRAGSGGSVTTLVRDGRTLAAISHAAPGAEVVRTLGAAVRLAVDNERLQAEVRSRAEDVRASRARIVEASDGERRRLERDLHDGAQQRLLALSYRLRLAQAAAEAEGEGDTASVLAGVVDQAVEALGELRGLAHGIYPAILTEAGLGPALATAADSAAISVDLVMSAVDRYPRTAEAAAYIIVTEALDDAAVRLATGVRVEVERVDERLMVAVEDDGSPRGDIPLHAADRVGALGGSIRVEPDGLRAEIPCA